MSCAYGTGPYDCSGYQHDIRSIKKSQMNSGKGNLMVNMKIYSGETNWSLIQLVMFTDPPDTTIDCDCSGTTS